LKNIYRTEACDSCHQSTGEGNVLINGRGIIYSFKANKMLVDGIDDLYAYLKGRSDGAIPADDLTEMK